MPQVMAAETPVEEAGALQEYAADGQYCLSAVVFQLPPVVHGAAHKRQRAVRRGIAVLGEVNLLVLGIA